MNASPRLPDRISPPRRPLPEGACDSHAHVFGPFDRFPLADARTRTPPEATPNAHRTMQRILGFDRSVIVQGSAHGTDNRAVADAIAAAPDAVRGIGVVDESFDDAALAALVAAGFCGMRFTEFALPGGQRKPVSGFATLAAMAGRLAAHNLHAQLFTELTTFADSADAVVDHAVPIVIDHMAKAFPTPVDLASREAHILLGLLREGRVWVKLTVIRGSADYPHYSDMRAFHDALIAANPARLLWGTDWPLLSLGDKTPDPGALIDLFDDWTANDPAIRQAVFVDNPARLYGFCAAGQETA